MADDKVTTPGSLMVRDMLPEKVRPHYDTSTVLDKKGVKNLMSDLVRYGGDDAHTSLSNLSSLFFNTATDEGYTTPLTDYENDSKERETQLREFSHKVNEINSKNLTHEERSKKLKELSNKYGEKLIKQNLDYMVGKGSTAGKMALTGARGNPDQLSQATSSPLMGKDLYGNPIPVPIKKSFAEGLSPAEHTAMSYEGRSNTVKSQLSTSQPGALFKRITPTVFHETITSEDCGTTNGVHFDLTDSNKKKIIYRVEAGTNKVVDEAYYKKLVMEGDEKIKLRSSMTCEANEGVCQRCYGWDSRGRFPPIGENVGVVAAQSVSETLTQAVLSTKHQSGVGKQRNPFEQARNLLEMPENFQDEATVSKKDGKVTQIEKTPLNDHKVHVDGIAHFVPRAQEVRVKKGDSVKPGDPLSTGTINPKELVNLRGLGEGRKYMSNKLQEVYGADLDNRHFDLLSKNLMKHVKVKDPGDTGFMPEQRVEVSKIHPILKKDSHEVPTKEAIGKKLAVQALEITPGTKLDRHHVDYLLENGVNKVRITKSNIEVEPEIKGVGTAKLLDKNWISRLSLDRLTQSVQDAAAFGEESEIHSTDPITSYIMGSEFGEGKHGKY